MSELQGCQPVRLFPYQEASCSEGFTIEARAQLVDGAVSVSFHVRGPISTLCVPPPGTPERSDGLWRHTCFELFLLHTDESYWEVNLSPSTAWAFYRFRSYRQNMIALEVAPPDITSRRGDGHLQIDARIVLPAPLRGARLNLTAVLQHQSGERSYWAARHPSAGPDFHNPDCFVFELPPPSGA